MSINTTEILNEIEHDKLLAFKEDKVMFGAVKKYILYHLYNEGVVRPGEEHKGNVNWAIRMAWDSFNGGMPRTDKELGENLRAMAYGIQIVESGFKEIGDLVDENQKDKEEETNDAE